MTLTARGCVALRGDPTATAALARRLTAALPDTALLWVGDGDPRGLRPGEVRRWLGQSVQAVVLDAHRGVDANLLGQCHGFVQRGGRLVLRLPAGALPTRFGQRVERALWSSPALVAAEPMHPGPLRPRGTAEQAALVDTLAARLSDPSPSRVTLTARRGRGKSSALGLALARLPQGCRVALTAPQPGALREVLRFATGSPEPGGGLAVLAPDVLASQCGGWDVIVVDEAAQLSVARLRQLVAAHPTARIAFATTAMGYEGTGRGFALRFVPWMRRERVPVASLTLSEPVRWDPGDPLERLTDYVLALDAAPAAPTGAPARPESLRHDALADDEPLLRQVFGLLVHAHYRTAPRDLQLLLDDPAMGMHVMRADGRVVAANLVAREGGLPAETCARLAAGAGRIQGQALPDTLICHSGHPEAGRLRMLRSVRIAVHPEVRRAGLATYLAEHVHQHHPEVDLFGTLFGATEAIIAFRRALGYVLVRLGVSFGARTGEPSAVMVRPVSPAAHALVDTLRRELARDLPAQIELMRATSRLPLDPALVAAVQEGLPAPAGLTDDEADAVLRSYVLGPRPSDTAYGVLRAVVERRPGVRERLTARERALVEGRFLRMLDWDTLAAQGGHPSPRAVQRALRRVMRAYL